jgi:hypothetical protein
VSDEEMEPCLNLAQQYLAKHGDFWAAAKYGVRAIMTSPNFLYLAETTPSDSKKRKVSDALGRRMSFADRDDIDRIVTGAPEFKYGLRELIQQIVASEAFHTR